MKTNVIILLCLTMLLSSCASRITTQIVDFDYSNKCEETAETWGEAVECLIRKKNNQK